MTRRAYRTAATDSTTFYPRLVGTHGAVAANSYLAVDAGVDVLKAGGNAIDAAVAASFVEGLVDPQMHTIGGECPILIRVAGADRVYAINGNGAAPRRATPEEFRRRGLEHVPDEDILAATVPAAFGALVTALLRFGTLPLHEVMAPVIALAKNGFPASQGLVHQERYGLKALAPKFEKWSGSRAIYLPVPEAGALLRNEPLARTYEHLARAKDPLAEFYRGEVAAQIARYSKERDGLLELSDLENFETHVEAPQRILFGEAQLFKCGFWSQGPAMLQALQMLKQFDLQAMRFDSADYLHVLIETMKLVFADREQYYGDPAHIVVPSEVLLSDDYAKARSGLIDMRRASPELRPGDALRNAALLAAEERFTPQPWGPGTVHVDAIDAKGNMASFTPSGAWIKSAPVIDALGFPLSTRMMTFYLGPPNHPNVVAPGKRPRTTLTPSLAFRRGKPWMTFGTMGGDQQEQWSLQFILYREAFGMTLQQAIEAPKLSTNHFPGFFAPHDHQPRHVRIEPRFGAKAIDELRRRGHEIEVAPDWTEGFLSAAELHADGRLEAGCDPRGSKSETFPSFAYCW
jgi:gamma-glutamyltranspeptidase/glutathione hydrolase